MNSITNYFRNPFESVPKDREVLSAASAESTQVVEDGNQATASIETSKEEDLQPIECELTTATLGQLLTMIIPDADVHSPDVIVVGAQSSGKTKMIISMVFHHLIENSAVTDAMGEKLLRIFQTGEQMVTRRPTKIQFVKTSKGSPCTISLRLGAKSASFDDPTFDEIVDSVHQESANRDGKAFRGELLIKIAAPGLPNISFTDLPGLTTFERPLSDGYDGECMTMHDLVKQYMSDRQSTIVVVEPASLDDFNTSQISPLLKRMQEANRNDIFDTAVLVLSKCDTVRHGDKIMKVIEKTSAKMANFPYKHVVGVINKVDSGDEAPDHVLSYASFKQQFKSTKLHERAIFSTFLNRDQAPCSTKEQCTTAAVFHQMDKITFGLVHRSIEKGLESIQEKVEDVEQKIRDELAPPPDLYTRSAVATCPPACPDAATVLVPAHFARSDILKLAQQRLQALVEASFGRARLHVYEYDQRGHNQEYLYLTSIGVDWPATFEPGSMAASYKRREAIDQLRLRFERFVDKKVADAVDQVLTDREYGCFAAAHSPLHRIDRFPFLVAALRQGFQALLPDCLQKGKIAINAHLDHFWQFDVPKGASLGGMVDQLKYVALRAVFDALCAHLKDEQFDAVMQDDALFVEQAEFAEHRRCLHDRWEHLRQQAAILSRCSAVTNNEDLKATLQQAHADQRALAQTSWQDFWRRAEQLTRNRSVRDLASVCAASHTDDDSDEAEDSDSAMDEESEDECANNGHNLSIEEVTPSKRVKTVHNVAQPSYRNNILPALPVHDSPAQGPATSSAAASASCGPSGTSHSGARVGGKRDYSANLTSFSTMGATKSDETAQQGCASAVARPAPAKAPTTTSPTSPTPVPGRTSAVLHSYAAVLSTPSTYSVGKTTSCGEPDVRAMESAREAKGSSVFDLTDY